MSRTAIDELIGLPSQKKQISISIDIGNRQSGTITFQESGKSKITKTGSLNYSVENSDLLDQQTFVFNITCTNVNPDSNKLVVQVSLDGADNNGPWTLEMEVDEDDSYVFIGKLKFLKL